MNNPLVSIIIPLYNVGHYVRKCLDSVLNQTYNNLEIIIVDNNSTDECPSICKDYAVKDKRIKLEEEKIQASGAARDKGVEVAGGEWICFVDSDDILHPKYVEILLETVVKYDCLTAQCKYLMVDEQEAKQEDIDGSIELMDWRNYFIYLFEHSVEGFTPFGPCCNIYHKSLFEDVRFGAVSFADDSGFKPRIIYAAASKPIALIDKTLYFYYQREGSLLHSKTSMINLERYGIKKEVLDFWKKNNEIAMYTLFYNDFINCLILDYVSLCIALPNEKEEYSFLKNEIEARIDEETWYASPYLQLHHGARTVWEKLNDKNGRFVLYGYGRRGKEVYSWLHYCNIEIAEIWDQTADGLQTINGTPICKPHEGFNKDVIILISIENFFTICRVMEYLKKLGYEQFIGYNVLKDGIKYGQYEAFLPCLIECYKELTK